MTSAICAHWTGAPQLTVTAGSKCVAERSTTLTALEFPSLHIAGMKCNSSIQPFYCAMQTTEFLSKPCQIAGPLLWHRSKGTTIHKPLHMHYSQLKANSSLLGSVPCKAGSSS